jgi:RecB family endonuclease NucS
VHAGLELIECNPDKLNMEVHNKSIVIVVGDCMTLYEGRGAAHSEFGDKIIIVKQDGSVIVHGPTGFKPLNWQPDTIHASFHREGDHLVLKAVRGKPRETLVVKCREVYGCTSHTARSKGGFYMYFSEAEIRDILKDNPWMIEEGIRITEVEKPVQPGFIDLYGIDKDGRVVVFEIKRVKASEEAARQLYGYVEKLRKAIRNVRGVLLAPGFTESALEFLQKNGLEAKIIDLKKLYEMYSEKVKRKAGLSSRNLLDYMD